MENTKMPIPTGTRPTFKKKENAYQYDNLPEDTYQVEITDIEHSVEADPFAKDKSGEEFDYLKFTFIVLNPNDTFEGTINGEQPVRGRRMWVQNVKWKMSPPGDYPASKLYRIASAVNGGKVFNKTECNSFNPNDLIGRQLRIVVKEKPGKNPKFDDNGNAYTPMYNNVTDFMSTRKLMQSWDQETEGFKPKDKTDVVESTDFDSGDDVPF